jgi:hypothetical protein
MRSNTSLVPGVLVVATAFALVASIFISANPGMAADDPPGAPPCTCPDARNKVAKPKFADLHALDESDEIAALESVQVALSRVGDGTTFVWRRRNGRLAGIVKPTSSFRNPAGTICRHVMVLLTTGIRTKKTEGVACRLGNGRWQLEG